MNELDKILITSVSTICGGIFIFILGQLLTKLVIEPMFVLRSLIADISDNMTYYAHIYSNPGTAKSEIMQEAKYALRQKASLLRAHAYTLPLYWLFALLCFVPSRKNIKIASGELIGLSNGIFQGDPMINRERAISIRSALYIPEE
jgi:hypothetical protein